MTLWPRSHIVPQIHSSAAVPVPLPWCHLDEEVVFQVSALTPTLWESLEILLHYPRYSTRNLHSQEVPSYLSAL